MRRVAPSPSSLAALAAESLANAASYRASAVGFLLGSAARADRLAKARAWVDHARGFRIIGEA